MPFSLVKAIKSTHMNPTNRMLHCIGGPFYIFGIVMIIGHFLGSDGLELAIIDRNNSTYVNPQKTDVQDYERILSSTVRPPHR